MTEALKAAEQARLAKQGEVTILRANIEKVCIVARDWDCSRLTQGWADGRIPCIRSAKTTGCQGGV